MTLVTKISFYNFWLFTTYLLTRYKVFVREEGRGLFTEFNLQDITSSHYVLLHNNHVIGTARVIYKGNAAQIGRFAILKSYRKQGYGKLFMRQLVSLIQNTNKAQTITLLAFEPNLVDFYTQFGFREEGTVYLGRSHFIQMSKSVH